MNLLKLLSILILFLSLFIFGCKNYSQVEINEKIFKIEVADNPAERAQGLMFRDDLKEDYGMLFIFSRSDKYGFWMKNTKVPLDIIWINKNKEIVFIEKDANYCYREDIEECEVYFPTMDSLYVLEINANLTEKYDIKVGDKVEIS